MRDFNFSSSPVAPSIVRTTNRAGASRPIVGSGEHVYEVIHDWGELPLEIQYGNTHGVCEDSEARIYVYHTVHKDSQSQNAMVVFDADGKFVASWGPEFLGGAHGLQLHKEGGEEFLYLCDKDRAIVVKVTLKGEQVWRIGYPDEIGCVPAGL
jgi:hypothetical protein